MKCPECGKEYDLKKGICVKCGLNLNRIIMPASFHIKLMLAIYGSLIILYFLYINFEKQINLFVDKYIR